MLALALAACFEVQEQAAEGAVEFDCAVGPGAEMGADFMVERAGEMLVIRHRDGSFLRLSADELSASDGPDATQVLADDETVEIRVAGGRHSWPKGALNNVQ